MPNFHTYDEYNRYEEALQREANARADDERDEEIAREMSFIEYNACVPQCSLTGVHTLRCEASGAWSPVAAALAGWVGAVTQRRAA